MYVVTVDHRCGHYRTVVVKRQPITSRRFVPKPCKRCRDHTAEMAWATTPRGYR